MARIVDFSASGQTKTPPASGNAEGAIVFDAKAWVKTADYYAANYRMRESVAKAFGEAGISAPSIPVNVKNV